MFGIKVNGGTGAGSKRPLREKPTSWLCACGGSPDQWWKPGYLTKCSDCGVERP